jgi:hypothetical protein
MRYGELSPTAQPGFNFIWQTSKAIAVPALSNAFTAISSSARYGTITR